MKYSGCAGAWRVCQCLLLGLLCLVAPQKSTAHELLPTIADMSLAQDGVLILDFRINLEALLAGVDLDAVSNTDDDTASDAYDALRRRPGAEIEIRAPEIIDAWNAVPLVTSSAPVTLELRSLTLSDDIDFELPRIAEMRVAGLLPPDAETVVIRWPAGSGALVLRQQGVSEPYTGYLNGGTTSPAILLGEAPEFPPQQVILEYLPLGVAQVLPRGLDHMLFVLGLFLLSAHWRPLVWQLSLFALGFAVTMGLAALGHLSVPAHVVAPVMAASVVYVAIENLIDRALSLRRLLLVFCFGLFHGLAFAAGFSVVDVPDAQVLVALAGYGLGVEIGQLAVIAIAGFGLRVCVLLAGRSALNDAEAPAASYPVMFRAVSFPLSLAMAVTGLIWCVQRLTG